MGDSYLSWSFVSGLPGRSLRVSLEALTAAFRETAFLNLGISVDLSDPVLVEMVAEARRSQRKILGFQKNRWHPEEIVRCK